MQRATTLSFLDRLRLRVSAKLVNKLITFFPSDYTLPAELKVIEQHLEGGAEPVVAPRSDVDLHQLTTESIQAQLLGQLYECKQGTFCLDPADQFIAAPLIRTGEYDPMQLEQLRFFCTPDSSVLLLGAHIGAIAVPLSKMVKNMTAFEANPDTYKLFSINLKLNDCSNVEAFNLAANDKSGAIEFVLNTVNSAGSKRLPLHHDEAYFYDNPKVVTVPAVALDEFLKGKRYDIVFMDIEGSEYFAMLGMPEIVRNARVVFSEFLPHHLSRVAGVPIENFASCFSEFQTLIIPSLKQIVHGDSIRDRLVDMFNNNQEDGGIIFVREKIEVHFTER
jgi:FkbM family methyltransferase